jgi:hypothetical protein
MIRKHGYRYQDRNGRWNQRANVRSVRWHGPRFIKGRRSSRLTAVWTLRVRKTSTSEVLA